MNNSLSLYENSKLTLDEYAKVALVEFKSVEEIKNFRDIVVAAEAYAKQSNDMELENNARKARQRAEKSCGALLKRMDKAKNKSSGSNQYEKKNGASAKKEPAANSTPTLADMGITKKQSSDWQVLADIPPDEFEDAINDPGNGHTTSGIVARQREKINPKPESEAIDKDSLWLWGRVTNFEKDNRFDTPIKTMADGMPEPLRAEFDRLFPKLQQWVNNYECANTTD